MSHSCRSCGKFSFPQPTTCFWCSDDRSEAEIQASIREGIERSMDESRKPPPTSAFEDARLKLHKYRRYESRQKGGQQ